jgi:hypothetical protein
MPIFRDVKDVRTLVLVFQVGPIDANKRATIIVSGCRGTITNENTTKFVLWCLLEDCRAVGIVEFKICAIFWKCKVCRFVGTMVDFSCAFFNSKSFRIGDFNTNIALHIFDKVDRTIKGLFFELFGKVLSEQGVTSLSMLAVIQTETGVLRIESLDAVDVRWFNRRGMETPRAAICFTDNGVARFIAFFGLIFERVLDRVSFARVFKFFNGIKRVADVESDNWNIHTAQKGRGTYKWGD